MNWSIPEPFAATKRKHNSKHGGKKWKSTYSLDEWKNKKLWTGERKNTIENMIKQKITQEKFVY